MGNRCSFAYNKYPHFDLLIDIVYCIIKVSVNWKLVSAP